MGYSLCMMADFKMVSFLVYLVFFGAVFSQNSCKSFVEWIFT